MEYLFLKRKETSSTSQRQKNLLFKVAEKHWEEEFVMKGRCYRGIDCLIYKNLLYQLEIKKVFLNPELSLKRLSAMIDTNQTYLSNVVNRYFECNLKELLNNYRIEYAKELLDSGLCPLVEIPKRCGFASRSPFYSAFRKLVGKTPMQYVAGLKKSNQVLLQ